MIKIRKIKKLLFTVKSVCIPSNSFTLLDICPNVNIRDICEIETCDRLNRKHGLISANSLFIPDDSKTHKILVANESSLG